MAVEKTYFPPSEPSELAEITSFMDAYREKRGEEASPQVFLSGPKDGSQISLPMNLYDILVQAVDALNQGKAVTVHPNSVTVTTQDAAELLGVSRPTVVKLIEEGVLSATKIRRHRRIRLDDVVAYRDVRCNEQLDFVADTSDDVPAPRAEEFRRVRAEVARGRSARRKLGQPSEPRPRLE